jgi:hypothetical protein
MAHRVVAVCTFLAALTFVRCSSAAEEPVAENNLKPILTAVDHQPLAAHAERVSKALELVGAPLNDEQQKMLRAAIENKDAAEGITGIQAVLDSLAIAAVNINPESRVKVADGPARRELIQNGWRVFLVKVHNEAGVTAELRVTSPNAQLPYRRSSGSPEPKPGIQPHEVRDRWLDIDVFDKQPLAKRLSGGTLEYRIVQLYSRDSGKREAKLAFDVGQGTQDLGFRNESDIVFNCRPSVEVKLEILDDDGTPTTGQFVIRDSQGRIYPSMTKRLAPDFFFHQQVYRHNGESVLLPPGKYRVTYTRGPEYLTLNRDMIVPPQSLSAASVNGAAAAVAETPPPVHHESFRLKRWIDMKQHGWYSGDHHVHAAGCAHYDSPTEGVKPEDMMRHILGEDLNVGCVLSWGPCWYAQKQFFEGKVHALSQPKYLMRYDIEVSGFPSQHCGHLCLLRLREDDYPGTTRIEEWPTWTLPILQWGKEQGGVVGYSHSGWGLAIKEQKLPSYEMPPFDGIGANEYIVTVVHDACDFISSVDTPIHYELNIWYHTLNCGFTAKLSGETDFPCIYGERVGLGRGYVKLNKDEPLDFDRWVAGIKDGKSYVGDGYTHLFDFTANGLGVGEPGKDGRNSVLAIKSGEPVRVEVKAASLLGERADESIQNRPWEQKPYWHVERARIGNTRRVPVELIVNGESVERREIEADGDINDLSFEFKPKQSSWVALRVFATAHTNPIYVEVDGKPIRASRKSAQWCLDAVDVCWNSKRRGIREPEREAAAAAYDKAREVYRQILSETTTE